MQPLGDDDLVLANQPGSELMQVVLAAITHPKVLLGELPDSFSAVITAFLLAAYGPLQTCQPALRLLQMPGISNRFPGAQGGQCADAHIYSDAGMDSFWQRSDIGFHT
jgi:hypothetical protein